MLYVCRGTFSLVGCRCCIATISPSLASRSLNCTRLGADQRLPAGFVCSSSDATLYPHLLLDKGMMSIAPICHRLAAKIGLMPLASEPQTWATRPGLFHTSLSSWPSLEQKGDLGWLKGGQNFPPVLTTGLGLVLASSGFGLRSSLLLTLAREIFEATLDEYMIRPVSGWVGT